ncbi:MAG: YqgE/AlgH family protein [Pseudomonadota bacterium]
MQIDTLPFPLTGRLLVAMPGVADDVFKRGVILICAHSRRGAMGVLLNRLLPPELRSDVRVDRNFAGTPSWQSYRSGGPAGQDTAQYLHNAEKPLGSQTIQVARGLNLTPVGKAPAILSPSERPTRVLLASGHCGWAAGQVEDELRANVWLTSWATTEFVFHCPPKQMWRDALGLMGVSPSGLSTEVGHA